VFEGNVADPATLCAQVSKLKRRFGLSRVVLVGDRGMITSAGSARTSDRLAWIGSPACVHRPSEPLRVQ